MDKETKAYEAVLTKISAREQGHIEACDECDARTDEIMAELETVKDPKKFDALHQELNDIADTKRENLAACLQCAQEMSDAAPPMFYGLEPFPVESKKAKQKLQGALQAKK